MRGDGDAELLEDIMSCREAVFRICLGFSRNASDAEDLSQDVYLKAYRSLGRVRHRHLVKEWLFRIARNHCLDHMRRRRFARELDKAAGPVHAIETRTPETASVGE